MSLQIVIGNSGAGKSHTIYREVIEASIAHPEKQFLVIVPEQFTMQAQKEIVRLHPRHGLLNVDILSFHRLAWRIFAEVGGNTLPLLEETGKTLIVQRIVAKNQKELSVLGRALTRPGAVLQMKSLLSELLQYGITPEDLQIWQENQTQDSLLAHKLTDIEHLYRAFRTYIENTYVANEEIPEVLCRVIGKSRLLQGCEIVFDGFTGFTPLQYDVLREILRMAARVQVLVTIDTRLHPMQKLREYDLFHMSGELVRNLCDRAKETGTEVLPIRRIEAGKESRFAKSPSLAFLEQNLFRYTPAAYADEPEQIFLYEAADPRQELEHIAAEILRQVRTERRHFKDFAVLTGDLEQYGEEAAMLFAAEGIPCFLDRKHSVLTNLLVEGIRAALQMVAKSYSYESVLRYLRSGLSAFSTEETDELENYILALGLRGRKRYEENWVRLPSYLAPDRILFLNTLREKFLKETEALHAGLHDRKGTIRTKIQTLRDFLERQQIGERIRLTQEELLAEGAVVSAKEYDQIEEAVTDLLEKVEEILGEEKAGVRAFAELLDVGFSELTIGTIPPGEDQVMIGDMERTRLKKIEVLFFAGVNEGVVPGPVSGGGILSEVDRERLRTSDLTLAPTPREERARQRYYLYLALTKPSCALHLSYARVSKDAKSQTPSYLITTLRRLFPKLQILHSEDRSEAEALETASGRRSLLLSALQKLPLHTLSPKEQELFLWMQQETKGKARLERLLTAAEMQQSEDGIGKRIATRLYGKELLGSASRLETFAACAFQHFCRYGLQLREREIYDFTPADLGSVMHAALEAFSLLLKTEGCTWRGMSAQMREYYADRALEEVVTGYGNDILHSSGRNTYLIERLRDLLHHTVWALQTQVEQGEFEPSDFEFHFTDDLAAARVRLSQTEEIRLTGRIDRIDLCEQAGTEYVKIIDYKTGKAQFDLNKLYYGLQLQLVLYLNAALENEQKKHPEKQVEPAGIFYYHVDDPYLTEEDGLAGTDVSEEVLEQKLLEKLRPDGKCRSEKEVLDLLDTTLAGGAHKSRVIPVEYTKKGELAKAAKVADREEFHLMRSHAQRMVQQLGTRILAGETRPAPALYRNGSACAFCPYAGICGFDPDLPGHTYRKIPQRGEDELYAHMKKEEMDPSNPSPHGQ